MPEAWEDRLPRKDRSALKKPQGLEPLSVLLSYDFRTIIVLDKPFPGLGQFVPSFLCLEKHVRIWWAA